MRFKGSYTNHDVVQNDRVKRVFSNSLFHCIQLRRARVLTVIGIIINHSTRARADHENIQMFVCVFALHINKRETSARKKKHRNSIVHILHIKKKKKKKNDKIFVTIINTRS